MATANQAILSKLKIAEKHELGVPLPEKTTLQQLAEMGVSDPDIAWPVFEALWTELQSTKANDRPPVLLAIDSLHYIMRQSRYMSSDFKPIHAHDLALVSFFNTYLSGSKHLVHGGTVLASTSASDIASSPSLDFAIAQNEAAQNAAEGQEGPVWSPFAPLDTRVMQAMSGVEIFRLGGLTKDEAAGVMKYYFSSGMLRQNVTDVLVAEKWALSGGGIIGELEKNTVLWRL